MTEKFKGEVPPQEHEQGEKVTIDFKEVVDSILDEGRISIEKSSTDQYPSEAREMLEAITEEEVKEAILKQADFSEAMTWYVERLNEQDHPISMCVKRTEKALGVARTVFLTIKEDPSKNVKINANVDLLHLYGQKPEIKVYLYASKIDFDFECSSDDGRCLNCNGWGCWECGFSGGYQK